MAFINEDISDADKELFYSFNFRNPLTRKPIVPSKWTIDRDRDIFLVMLGGQGLEHSEIPMVYALIWENNLIMIETYSGGQGDFSIGVEKWWKIARIVIPESLAPQKVAVIELIKEALDAHGLDFNREQVKKIEFRFISSPVWFREA